MKLQDKNLENILGEIMDTHEEMVVFPSEGYAKVIEMDVLLVNKIRVHIRNLYSEFEKQRRIKGPHVASISKMDLDLWELQEKLRIQEKLVKDKQMHFQNVFTPRYEQELEECKRDWLNVYEKAKEVAAESSTHMWYLKIRADLDKYHKNTRKYGENNVELQNGFYKSLRRLLGAVDTLKQTEAMNIAKEPADSGGAEN